MYPYKYVINHRTGQWNVVPASVSGVSFKPAVASFADLPLVGNIVNDARITNDTDHLYIWSGSAWVDQGNFVTLEWAAIDGRPNSTPAEIDAAVEFVKDFPSGYVV